MSRLPWALVALLVASSLAGCIFQDDGPEGRTVQPGDFVRIHYVARYDDNGTVLESTYDGRWPAGAELAEVPFEEHLEAQFWIYMWHPSTLSGETGRNLTVDARFRDLNADDFRESMFLSRADRVQANGSIRSENEQIRFYDVPLAVIGDPNRPLEGMYEAILGRTEGELIEDHVVPPAKAYGEENASQIQRVSRFARDQNRTIERTPDQLRHRSNFSDGTEVGDVVSYRLFNTTPSTARVLNITDEQVTLYVHMENGTQVSVPLPDIGTPWNATIVDVTNATYALRYEPEIDRQYVFEGRRRDRTFRVVELTDTEMVLDFNDPRAGETIVYDIKVLDIVRPELQELFRGRTVDPFKGGSETIHDVAMLAPTNALIGTDRGLFLTTDFGRSWYPFSLDFLGDRVDLVQPGATRRGEVWVVADGELWHTNTTGFNWTRRSPGGEVVGVGQPADRDRTVYALVAGDGLHRSDDRGRTWERVSSTLTSAKAIAAGPDPDTVWAATGSGLRRSIDGGESFATFAHAGLDVRDIHVVDDHSLYAVVDGTFNVSTDLGGTWGAVDRTGRDLSDIGFSRKQPSTLIGTSTDDRLLVSFNGGEIWGSPAGGG